MNKSARYLAALVLWLLAAVVAHAGTVTYIHTDAQGTPVMESDAQGHITKRFEYTPYGVVVTSVGAAPDGPGYTGHVNDPETGLVYMQQRYYDPVAGRFLSIDPIDIGAKNGYSFNRYTYAFNNPSGLTDPTGAYPSHMTASQINCEIYRCNVSGDGSSERGQLAIRATREANTALKNAGVLGQPFSDLKDLLISWSDIVSPITARLQVEIGSDIMYMKNSGYLSSSAYSTGDRTMINFQDLSHPFIAGLVAEIHTHPINVGFSGMADWAQPYAQRANGYGDLAVYYNDRVDGYVALPGGAIYGWSYNSFFKNMNDSGSWQYLRGSVFTVRGK